MFSILVFETEKISHIPKLLGILLLIASVSYIIIHLSHLFLPQHKNLTIIFENVLSLPMALGELGFGIWLLIKGQKIIRGLSLFIAFKHNNGLLFCKKIICIFRTILST